MDKWSVNNLGTLQSCLSTCFFLWAYLCLMSGSFTQLQLWMLWKSYFYLTSSAKKDNPYHWVLPRPDKKYIKDIIKDVFTWVSCCSWTCSKSMLDLYGFSSLLSQVSLNNNTSLSHKYIYKSFCWLKINILSIHSFIHFFSQISYHDSRKDIPSWSSVSRLGSSAEVARVNYA